ncbi:hypothetical protein [Paenibacillus illinoisensis]|uniref:hypothetical protein n=1 Tax=Paenibacillus illinoisensis TaxID=59845 RepID=UPI00301E47E3
MRNEKNPLINCGSNGFVQFPLKEYESLKSVHAKSVMLFLTTKRQNNDSIFTVSELGELLGIQEASKRKLEKIVSALQECVNNLVAISSYSINKDSITVEYI